MQFGKLVNSSANDVFGLSPSMVNGQNGPSGEILVTYSTKIRRAFLVSIIVGSSLSLSSGCSKRGFSLASMNPFSRSSTVESVKPTTSLAATNDASQSKISAMGASAKNAVGKTTSAVAGVFRRDKKDGIEEISDTDPLKLTNEPAEVGPEVLVANGQLWESTGNFQKAMESYNKALTKAPNDSQALTSIARLHFRQGNHTQAAEFFGRAIKQSPQDAALYNDLGLTMSKLGNHPQATQALTRALELAPSTSRYANNLASVLFESGNTQGAFDVLQKNNKPAVAHFNMAYLHYSKGQMNEARTHLSNTMKLEAEGATDPAIQKAVNRSREMLAQIDASVGTAAQTKIAQAIPPVSTSPTQSQPAPLSTAPQSPMPPSAAVNNAPAASIAAKPATTSLPAKAVGYRPATTTWVPTQPSATPQPANPMQQPPSSTAPAANGTAPAASTTLNVQAASAKSNVTSDPATAPKWVPTTWPSSTATTTSSTSSQPVQPSQPVAPATTSTAPNAGLPTGFMMPTK